MEAVAAIRDGSSPTILYTLVANIGRPRTFELLVLESVSITHRSMLSRSSDTAKAPPPRPPRLQHHQQYEDILPALIEQLIKMSKSDNNISGRLALVTGASGG